MTIQKQVARISTCRLTVSNIGFYAANVQRFSAFSMFEKVYDYTHLSRITVYLLVFQVLENLHRLS